MAKVEINTAEAQPTNEDAIAELKEQGINIETGEDADGNRAIATEPNIDAQTIENQRPDWLPEKFKSAEELSKAYSELEKQFSGKQEEPVNEEVKPEGLEIPKDAPSTGFDMGKFADEYADKGELSNNSYNELAKQGLDKGLVDEYIRGQKAIAETQTTQVYETVGGQEKYSELISWAGNNLSEGEQTAFNDLTATGSIDQIKLAVQGLMTKAGMTNQPQQEMIQGDVNNTAVEQFNSVQQVTEAMNDPRYDKDPVFRKEVERKLGNSSVF
jgi:hypothetical protein